MKTHALRLLPGEEVKAGLLLHVKQTGLKAAFILGCVGSVDLATLRLANADAATHANEVVTREERFEVLGLQGTFSSGGESCHIHGTFADASGQVLGGHVMALRVFTTCEIILGECEDMEFTRELDPATGFSELVVTTLKTANL
jgi:predicted DNA-binding protein with PD1-like motif